MGSHRTSDSKLARAFLALLLAVAGGCSDSGGDGQGQPDARTALDAGADGGTTMSDAVRYDDPFSATCLGDLRCDLGSVETACVCVPPAEADVSAERVGCTELPTEANRPRTFADDFCDEAGGGGAPDVSCFLPDAVPTAGTPEMVTLFGVVDVFGEGGNADDILVEVFREGVDGALGDAIGQATAVVDDPCAETEDKIEDDEVVGERQLGYYAIENVPSETPLIIKTTGDVNRWRPLYAYNVRIANAEIERGTPGVMACSSTPTGARYRHVPRTLSAGDYNSIPLTAGAGTISASRGALAGEVRDCSQVRIRGAMVRTFPEAPTTTYFSNDPSNPLPDRARAKIGTSNLGLYAALDLAQGPIDIATVARVNGELISLGWYRAQVFAGSVADRGARRAGAVSSASGNPSKCRAFVSGERMALEAVPPQVRRREHFRTKRSPATCVSKTAARLAFRPP